MAFKPPTGKRSGSSHDRRRQEREEQQKQQTTINKTVDPEPLRRSGTLTGTNNRSGPPPTLSIPQGKGNAAQSFNLRLPAHAARVYSGSHVLPWYESTLLWGAFGTVLALVLIVVAAMTKDLRWLLLAAWPFACLTIWALFKGAQSWRVRWALISAGWITVTAGLLWLDIAGASSFKFAVERQKPSISQAGISKESQARAPLSQEQNNQIPAQAAKQPSNLTKAEKQAIVRELVDHYEKTHKSPPSVSWVNQRLREQGQPFKVLVNSHPKYQRTVGVTIVGAQLQSLSGAAIDNSTGWQFNIQDSSIKSAGDGILNTNDNARFNIERTKIDAAKTGIKNLRSDEPQSKPPSRQ